jgi:hypothetical protein
MPKARLTDPITSVEAADSVRNLTDTKHTILLILKSPATDEQLIERYRIYSQANISPKASPSGIRSRRHELAEAGYLEVVGIGKSAMGRRSLIWGVK